MRINSAGKAISVCRSRLARVGSALPAVGSLDTLTFTAFVMNILKQFINVWGDMYIFRIHLIFLSNLFSNGFIQKEIQLFQLLF